MINPEALANKLDAANVLVNEDFETTFEYRVLRPTSLNDGPVATDDWAFLEAFRYVAAGSQLYVLRVVYKHPEGSSGAPPDIKGRQENVWARSTWSHHLTGDNAVSLYAQARPTDLKNKGFIFNLIEGRYSSLPSLSQLVRRAVVLDQSVEGGVLSYRFADDESIASRVQYTIRVKLEPTIVLLGYTVEISDSPSLEDFQLHVRLRDTYTVTEWQQVGDLRIPRIAVLETFGSVRADHPREPTRTIYSRQSFRKLAPNDVDPGLFMVPLPTGTRVYDDRYKVGFEIGAPYLALDGAVYECEQPIMEHPGNRLSEILQRARPHHPEQRSSPADAPLLGPPTEHPQSLPGMLRSPIALACLASLGGAALTLAILRFHRGRRKAV